MKKLRHHFDLKGKEATRAEPLLPPHLTALRDSEDTRAGPPVHRGGVGHSPLPAWLQTETLHRLCPAPHLC